MLISKILMIQVNVFNKNKILQLHLLKDNYCQHLSTYTSITTYVKESFFFKKREKLGFLLFIYLACFM